VLLYLVKIGQAIVSVVVKTELKYQRDICGPWVGRFSTGLNTGIPGIPGTLVMYS